MTSCWIKSRLESISDQNIYRGAIERNLDELHRPIWIVELSIDSFPPMEDDFVTQAPILLYYSINSIHPPAAVPHWQAHSWDG